PSGAPMPAIVDVTSKGYGVAVIRDARNPEAGDRVAWLIHPNDEVPASPQEVFSTVHDDQTAVRIRVFESTTDVLREELGDNLELVAGDLVGLRARQKAGQPFDVSFNLGSDGILRITAVARNGKELRLEAKISGLVPDEVKRAPLPAIQ